MFKRLVRCVLIAVIAYTNVGFAESAVQAAAFRHPFYVGVNSGYGSTTWRQLVPSGNNSNAATNMSTPIRVSEGGAIWGGFIGYELLPEFAVEGAYTRYPTAVVNFDPSSLFSFRNNDQTYFSTRTDSISASGKFMLLIPHTPLRAFSSVGVAGVHRVDMLTDRWRVSPSFSVGLNYNLTEHIMAEIGVNYTGGYGESELDPVQDYIPFLYSGFVRLAYRF